MNSIEPVTFLNLDLELDSKSDLSPLAEFIGSKNYVLFNGKVPRGYHLCAEPLIRGTLNGDIGKCTDHFLRLLEKCLLNFSQFGGRVKLERLTMGLMGAQNLHR